MIYKDKTFEISETQVKFKNRAMIIFYIILLPLMVHLLKFSKESVLLGWTILLIGLGFAIFVIKLFAVFFGFFFLNNIDISNIEYVRIHNWDNSIDKERKFWKTDRYKYHFPAGINKKKKPQVILIHIKDRKVAVGFVPENIETVISVLNEKGIKIIKKTHGAEQS